MNSIRNFSIIAHINHGKSTLSDRFIQICNGLHKNKMKEQVLDSMDLEKERGITIKSQIVTLNYKSYNNKLYTLNLIDTPGHIDFTYEVSRSLAACEGALLLIDAQQGIEAQTLVNFYTAIKMNIKILPVLNKIDLPNANPIFISQKIKEIIDNDVSDILQCSAKTGTGVNQILEHIINYVPAPTGDPNSRLQALIIDSWFDNYLGVIVLVRIKNGFLRKGDVIKVMSTNKNYKIERLGIFTPQRVDKKILNCGMLGWLACTIKNVFGAPVGDTLTSAFNPSNKVLPGFKKTTPQIYASLFPVKSDQYKILLNALAKLNLNDSSLFYELEKSTILGFGFRCGFLGLLHMEIIKERLEREYNLNLIITMPTVSYQIITIDNYILYINNPHKLPVSNKIKELREPIAECHILLPQKYVGTVINLCIEKRGTQLDMIYDDNQVKLIYEIPMAEVISDFFDKLKSVSHGYASLKYEHKYFKKSNIVCIKTFINEKCIDALTLIVHKNNALHHSYNLINKLKELIPRQQFDIIIQIIIGKRIIARTKIKQFRKNVTAKCHGGDINRKKKLLNKQKDGKRRLKEIGNIKLPQSIFLAVKCINKI